MLKFIFNSRRESQRGIPKWKKVSLSLFISFFILTLFLISSVSAEQFGYGKTPGVSGNTYNNNTYNNITNTYTNITQVNNITNNITTDAIVNDTQFTNNNPITISESWLTSFIQSFSYLTTWLIPDTTNGFLYNDSTYIYFNDTKLNEVIAENDTLDSVTTRGNVTSNDIAVGKVYGTQFGYPNDPSNYPFATWINNGFGTYYWNLQAVNFSVVGIGDVIDNSGNIRVGADFGNTIYGYGLGGKLGFGQNFANYDFDFNGTIGANSFVPINGTINDFLKGDGSLDNNTYCLSNGTNCPSNTGNQSFNQSLTDSLYYLKTNPSNFTNKTNLSQFINDLNTSSADLTGYAMLNGSNQPFTGNIILSNGSNTTLSKQSINDSFSITNSITVQPPSTITAVGGTITTVGSYKIHKFISGGSFNVTAGSSNIEILVVAGGGGGGGGWNFEGGGGGGAGGLVYNSSYAVTAGTNYTIIIGSGGAGGSGASSPGSNGQNSSFGTILAIGGGGGGGRSAGRNGGSGGGGGSSGSNPGGSGTTGQGNSGGSSSGTSGGGGGGASFPGISASLGIGGNGTSYDINGSSVYYAGGGGAGGSSNGAGGLGGGGQGATGYGGGSNGVANTGGGGGGAYSANQALPTTGGTGGSGVVIIKYLVNVTTTKANINIINSTASNDPNEKGINTLSDPTSRTIIEGLTTRFNVVGTTKGTLSSSGLTWVDNFKTLFGDAGDASFYYNATDMIINPKEVGTGKLFVLGEINANNNITSWNNNPAATNTYSLGLAGLRWLKLWASGLDVTGNINQTNGNTTINNFYGGAFTSNMAGETGLNLNATYQSVNFTNIGRINGFTLTNTNTSLQLTNPNMAGVYNCFWRLDEDGTANHNYQGIIFINGIQQNNTWDRSISSASGDFHLDGFGQITLNYNDNVTLRLKDTTGTSTPTVYLKDMMLLRTGN